MSWQDPERVEGIDLPAPTHWPIVTAFGVTLTFAGLVTSGLVTCVGFVTAIVAVVGWWRETLPEPREERIALRPPEQRAHAVVPVPGAVEHLKVGEAGHRVRIPVDIHRYSAGIRGGLVGAAAMAVVAVAYGLIAYASPWVPINLLAAMVIPSLAHADPAELSRFLPAAFGLAAVIHLGISILVGLIYAAILPMFPRRPVLVGGLVFPLLWSAVVWSSLGILNPALNERIDWVWFVASQFAFGLAAGFVISRTERVETLQTWPLAVRAGLEGTGLDRSGPDDPPREGPEA